MTTPHRCSGWAYELCTRSAIGVMYQRYAGGGWEAQYICMRHYLEVAATLDSRVEVPVDIELHALESTGPSWTRV